MARDKGLDHDSKNCSVIRAVTWCVETWFKSQFSKRLLKIGTLHDSKSASVFCKKFLPHFARGYLSGHDSIHCSEISAVTWYGNFFRFLKNATFVFFTPPYCGYLLPTNRSAAWTASLMIARTTLYLAQFLLILGLVQAVQEQSQLW